jgi:ATP adenylyltransferase
MAYLRGEEGEREGCIFCAKPEVEDAEAHILYRAERCYVILNRFPYNSGHLMVIPYAHVPSLEGLDSAALVELMAAAKLSLRVLREAYSPQGFNLGMNIGEAAGAGVAGHVHLHIVPRWAGDTNYMTITGHTRIIPEWMNQTYLRLRPLFERASKEDPQADPD